MFSCSPNLLHNCCTSARLFVRCNAVINGNAKTKVKFLSHRHVEFGQAVSVVGGIDDLGNWSPEGSPEMQWNEGDVWVAERDLPVGTMVEYKYIVRSPDGTVSEWTPGENFVLQIPDANEVVVEDDWFGISHEVKAGNGHQPSDESVEAMAHAASAATPDETKTVDGVQSLMNGALRRAAAAVAPRRNGVRTPQRRTARRSTR